MIRSALAFGPGNRLLDDKSFVLRRPVTAEVELDDFSGEAFDLQLPSISFDGVPLEFSHIRFKLISKVWKSPLNC